MPTDPFILVELIIGAMIAFIAIIALLFAVFIRGNKKTLELTKSHLREMTESERKYRYLFENSIIGMSRINVDTHTVLEMNESLAMALSVPSTVELEHLFFSKTPNPISQLVLDMRTRDKVEDVEYVITNPKGISTWFSVSAYSNNSEQYCTLVFTDVTARKKAAELTKTLAQRVVQAEEMERGRVAREIHDGVTQRLLIVSRALNTSKAVVAGPSAKTLASASRIVTSSIEELRRVAHNLRPSVLDDLGLVPALRGLVSELEDRTHLRIESEFRDVPRTLPHQTEITLYRFFQEAFSNIEKHAKARRVIIRLVGNRSSIQAEVRDDGRGIQKSASKRSTPQSGGQGLRGMKERIALLGGTFEVRSRPKKGTSLVVNLSTSPRQEAKDEIAKTTKNSHQNNDGRRSPGRPKRGPKGTV